MRKVAALAAVMTISLGALTACSGSSGYCSALKDNKDATNFSANGDFGPVIEKAKKVADKAPAEQKAHWTVLIEFMEKFQAAKGDPAKTAALAGDSAKVAPASQAIAKYAKDECKVEIAGA